MYCVAFFRETSGAGVRIACRWPGEELDIVAGYKTKETLGLEAAEKCLAK
jgi:hypothetical protein